MVKSFFRKQRRFKDKNPANPIICSVCVSSGKGQAVDKSMNTGQRTMNRAVDFRISIFESYSHPQSVPQFFFVENDLLFRAKVIPAKARAAVTMIRTVIDWMSILTR